MVGLRWPDSWRNKHAPNCSASPKPDPSFNPTPATCHKQKRKLHCSFWSAALQKLHCNIVFSAVRKSFGPKAALQQTKNCTATSKKLRCRKVALSCRFPADFKPPRLGTHVSDLLNCGCYFVSPLAPFFWRGGKRHFPALETPLLLWELLLFLQKLQDESTVFPNLRLFLTFYLARQK